MKWPSMKLWSQGKRTSVEALPELRVPCMKLEICFANGSQRHESLQTLPEKGARWTKDSMRKERAPLNSPCKKGLSQEEMTEIGIEWPKGRNWKLKFWNLKFEIWNWKLEIWKWNWNLEIDWNWKLEIDWPKGWNWKLEIDPKVEIGIDWPKGQNWKLIDPKVEIGNLEFENWKLEIGIENWEIGNLTRRSKLEIWKLGDPKVEIGNWMAWRAEIGDGWKLEIDQHEGLKLEIGWPEGRNWKLDGQYEGRNWQKYGTWIWWMISTKTEPKRLTDTTNQWDTNTSAQFWKNTSIRAPEFWKYVNIDIGFWKYISSSTRFWKCTSLSTGFQKCTSSSTGFWKYTLFLIWNLNFWKEDRLCS